MAIDTKMEIGKIVSVRGQVAEVEFLGDQKPAIHEVLKVTDAPDVQMEVYSSSQVNTFYCVVMTGGEKISRGMNVEMTGELLSIPVGSGVLGRVMNMFGQPIDGKGEIVGSKNRPFLDWLRNMTK